MTTSDKLREFGQKVMREYGRWWGVEAKDADKFVSDLTALISEDYVEKEKYDEAVRQRDKLREALADMVWQFAYRGTYEGRENLHTGGLSALESAFDALGLSDPITVLDFEAAIKNTER
jgi:hypothetical protein